MTRIRLRPAYSAADLGRLYAVPHDHTRWADHLMRVDMTIKLARELMPAPLTPQPMVIADLSCGDAAIGRALTGEDGKTGAVRLILGDIAPGYEITGPIEETIDSLPFADMFICSETVEHLDDPDAVLIQIRRRSRTLVLSTPLAEFLPYNPEHYWGWDHDGVREMLEAADWTVRLQRDVLHPLAQFQIWGCS